MSINIANVRYRENVDINVIDIMIDNFEGIISQFPIERQKKILQDVNHDYLINLKQLKIFTQKNNKDYITNTYNFAKHTYKGRLFAQNPSLQRLAREFRNTLC